ncbi:hypothetical protein NDU88_009408 [Pleurodeles waltl]|uniref:Uncharacterized protein n=1 Tax=Pleurodeles waltl TaxID=8319 RepID=A0AAV7RXH3_PLEWA|nr:hypothetical protein NDU88_009408 [Pleurodeles waltl]
MVPTGPHRAPEGPHRAWEAVCHVSLLLCCGPFPRPCTSSAGQPPPSSPRPLPPLRGTAEPGVQQPLPRPLHQSAAPGRRAHRLRVRPRRRRPLSPAAPAGQPAAHPVTLHGPRVFSVPPGTRGCPSWQDPGPLCR